MAIISTATVGEAWRGIARYRLRRREYSDGRVEYQIWIGARRIWSRHRLSEKALDEWRRITRPTDSGRTCQRCGRPLKTSPFDGGCYC